MSQSKLDHIIEEELAVYKEEQDSLVLQEGMLEDLWDKAVEYVKGDDDEIGALDVLRTTIIGIGAVIALVKGRAFFRGAANSLKQSAKAAKSAAKVETAAASAAFQSSTRSLFQAEARAFTKASKKFYDDIDDVIEGGGRLVRTGQKLDGVAINTLKNRIQTNITNLQNTNTALAKKIRDALSNPNVTDAEKRILQNQLKELKNHQKTVNNLYNNISNAKNMDGIVKETIAMSQKHGTSFFSRAVAQVGTSAKYGAGGPVRQGMTAIGRALIGKSKGLIWWIFSKGLIITAVPYAFKVLWNLVLKDMFTAEEVIEFFSKTFSLDTAAYMVHIIGQVIGIEDWSEAGARILTINDGRGYIKLMTEGDEADRVVMMKNLLGSLAILKMTKYPKVTYEQGLQEFQVFMENVDKMYTGVERGPKKTLVKENSLSALKQAQNEILLASYPMTELVSQIVKNPSKVVPGGVSAAEYLYERYFFNAVKQVYPGLPIDELALFKTPETRASALNDMLKYLKSVNAGPNIIKMFEKKVSNPAENIIIKSSLKQWLDQKFVSGKESDYINGVKDKAVNIAYKEVQEIINNH